MLWQDEGIVLGSRRFGESGLLLDLLTRSHGRHAGLVRGGAGRKSRPLFEVGNRLQVTWRARLDDQLGQYTAEPAMLVAGHLLDDPLRLLALGAACALLALALPERDPHPGLYDGLIGLEERLLEGAGWPEAYVRFELALLTELGFGLDLERCAVTGTSDGLAYVSPSTGRAVSAEGAGHYAPRLLPLPPFLAGRGGADDRQVLDGLRLTGAFLQRHLLDATERAMPAARERLIARLSRRL